MPVEVEYLLGWRKLLFEADAVDVFPEPALEGLLRRAKPLNIAVRSSASRHAGAIESPPRPVEVKAFGTSARGYYLWREVRQVEEVQRNPEFYVHVVENVRQGDPPKFCA